MWAYLLRRLLYNIPVFIGILLLVMLALRVRDPVYAYLGKNVNESTIDAKREEFGLTRPFMLAAPADSQFGSFVIQVFTLDFSEDSWDHPGETVGEIMGRCIGPSLALSIPALVLTTVISVTISLFAAWFRGRAIDQLLVIAAVIGMSVSFLVYIIFGQYWGAYLLPDITGHEAFAINGYVRPSETTWWEYLTWYWPHHCLLPVMISVIVAMGYDTRFYRAVMVEESGRDYITTARAKGASQFRVMFVHMLKNAMIPIITRVVITIPFLIMGSFLLETYFTIPGMGRELILAVEHADFPVVQAFTAVLAGIYILANLLTDALYALVDPRVRLS
ncbi:MAG: ABC transporter permease [Planctomycetaceae bacterium]